MIPRDEFRKLIITLLDDAQGVTETASKQLMNACSKYQSFDIMAKVKVDKGRIFLPEDHGLGEHSNI
jgi:hypothetical protein